MTDKQIEEFGRSVFGNFVLSSVFSWGTEQDKKKGVEMLRKSLKTGKRLDVIGIEHETDDPENYPPQTDYNFMFRIT